MKNIHSVLLAGRKDLEQAAAQAAERPRKIPIVFDDDVSAGKIKILIKEEPAPLSHCQADRLRSSQCNSQSKIMPALTFQSKCATSSSCTGSDDATIPATRPPLKISMVFDEDVSARIADTLIRRLASNFEYNLQSFAFDDLDPLGTGVAAARSVFDTDILAVAVCNNGTLPDHVQFWLGMCLGLRDQDQEGLLVVLTVKAAETADADTFLLEYLKTVAAIGKMEFISRQ